MHEFEDLDGDEPVDDEQLDDDELEDLEDPEPRAWDPRRLQVLGPDLVELGPGLTVLGRRARS